MSWNDSLLQYHKKNGGSFLGGEDDDGMLILTWKDRPLVVGVHMSGGGRYGPYPYVQARIPLTLGKPYRLTIGAESKVSGGLNAAMKAVPALAPDYGYPEVTKKRLIRSENQAFTKLVLGSLDLRNALLASPRERVEVRPGPGEEGLHQLTVTTVDTLDSNTGDWYTSLRYESYPTSDGERDQAARQTLDGFFRRMDGFLDLTRAAYNAVTQWPV